MDYRVCPVCKVLPFPFEVILYSAIVAESMTEVANSSMFFVFLPNISGDWDNVGLGCMTPGIFRFEVYKQILANEFMNL